MSAYYYRNSVTGFLHTLDESLIPISREEYLSELRYVWRNGRAQAFEDDYALQGATAITREQYEWFHSQTGYLPDYEETVAMQRKAPPAPTLAEVRRKKNAELAAVRAALVADGYVDEQGRVWGIDAADRAAWQELLTTAGLYGLADGDVLPTMVRERDGVTMHELTLGEYKQVLRGIAARCMQIDLSCAGVAALIAAATTIEELQAMEIPTV